MTLTRNELVLLSKGQTDVLRIIIIIINWYWYEFVSYIINPLALRARSATMWYMIIHNCTVRIRIKGSERSERGCDQYILWPYGGNICITYIKVVLKHFCHFFTRLSNPLVRYAHAFVVPFTHSGRPHCFCYKRKISSNQPLNASCNQLMFKLSPVSAS